MEFVVARRLESEFDDEATEFFMEEKPELDIVIVSHILSKNEQGDFECPICYDTVLTAKRVTISCRHRHDFCSACTKNLLKACDQEEKNVCCPMCRGACFLLETPDEPQFQELAELLELLQENREDQTVMDAFMYYHLAHPDELAYF